MERAEAGRCAPTMWSARPARRSRCAIHAVVLAAGRACSPAARSTPAARRGAAPGENGAARGTPRARGSSAIDRAPRSRESSLQRRRRRVHSASPSARWRPAAAAPLAASRRPGAAPARAQRGAASQRVATRSCRRRRRVGRRRARVEHGAKELGRRIAAADEHHAHDDAAARLAPEHVGRRLGEAPPGRARRRRDRQLRIVEQPVVALEREQRQQPRRVGASPADDAASVPPVAVARPEAPAAPLASSLVCAVCSQSDCGDIWCRRRTQQHRRWQRRRGSWRARLWSAVQLAACGASRRSTRSSRRTTESTRGEEELNGSPRRCARYADAISRESAVRGHNFKHNSTAGTR